MHKSKIVLHIFTQSRKWIEIIENDEIPSISYSRKKLKK